MAQFDFASAITTSGTTGSIQVTVGNNSNRVLYAFVSNSNTTLGVTGVTANGIAMSRVPGYPLHGNGSDITQDVWFLIAPPTGTYNIAVTNNGNDSLFMIEALSVYNASQTAPSGAPLHALDYAQTTTLSVPDTSASDLVVDFDTVSYGAGVTFTSPAPQTNRAQTHSATYRSSSISTSPGAVGNVTMTSNRTGISQPPSDYSYSAFVINDVGSGGTGGATVTETGAASAQSNTSSTGAETVTPAGQQATATVKTKPLAPFSGTVWAGITVPNLVVMKLDRTPVLSLSNVAVDGTAALPATSTAIIAGTTYLMAYWNADGSLRGIETVVAV